MYLIAGLGNPSLKYRHTRHNAGFDCIDVLAKRHGITIRNKEHFGLTGKGRINGVPVVLIKPLTYMNKSGESIKSAACSWNLDVSKELIVLVDDINLDYGNIRIREKGSAGGHNGLKDIIRNVGTEDFSRIRIGVGILPPEADLIRFVLTKPKAEDRKKLSNAYANASAACELMLSGQTQIAMSKYNGKQKS